jgi:transposase-like protein
MIFNVPYSPQFNPIEYVNNELKRQIRTQNIQNKKELIKFLELFIKKSSKKGFKNYFKKSYDLLGII